MSCNGCRVLRKGCSESCILRPCLQWIGTPEAQGHATVFVAKFFGRAGLMSFISGVAEDERPALFQSLLFEACGRTVNPVNGAVGLVGSGNWSVCQAAVETVLRGGILSPAAAVETSTNCYLGGSTIRTTQDPSSTSLNNNNNRIIKRRREAQAQIHDDDDDTSSHLLHLSLSSGPRSPLKKKWGNPAAALVYSEEESSMTSMESGCTATASATGGYTAPEKKLLNLFV